jgi:hypothetical protein
MLAVVFSARAFLLPRSVNERLVLRHSFSANYFTARRFDGGATIYDHQNATAKTQITEPESDDVARRVGYVEAPHKISL